MATPVEFASRLNLIYPKDFNQIEIVAGINSTLFLTNPYYPMNALIHLQEHYKNRFIQIPDLIF